MKYLLPIIVFAAISAFSVAEAARLAEKNRNAKIFPGAHWQLAESPEALDWSSGKLEKARAYSNRIGSAALMIVDDGLVVAQWGGIALKYPIHSMRKPLMSALIGIHAATGRIDLSKTLEALGIDDIGASLSAVEKQATIRDLLMSRSGVYHPALGEADAMKQVRPNRGSHSPGSFYYYNNWDFNAVGTIFEKETGTAIFDAFFNRIARPLQMEDFRITDGKYISGRESVHRVYALRMSARDLARFGLLYLRGGRWDKQQIVPSEWVRESTLTHSDIGGGRGYGYMWRTATGAGLAPNLVLQNRCFFHSGYGLHFLIVIPDFHLVIVHRVNTDSAGPYPQPHQIGRLFWMILDAAGETDIGANPGLEAAKGDHLTAEDLQTVLRANRFRVDIPSGLIEGGDQTFTVQFYDNGSLSLVDGAGFEEAGQWSVRSSKLCVELENLKECYSVLNDDGSVKLYDSTDTLFNSLTFLTR